MLVAKRLFGEQVLSLKFNCLTFIYLFHQQVFSSKTRKVFKSSGGESIEVAVPFAQPEAVSHLPELGCEHVLWGAQRSHHDLLSHRSSRPHAVQLHLRHDGSHLVQGDLDV